MTGSNSVKAGKHLALLALLLASAAPIVPALAQEEVAPAAGAQQASGIPEWGIASSDLAADQSVLFGRLENGMRYALKRNNVPEGQTAIRFTINVGGREEAEAEIGAAHFLEHMAFNGSTNIPEGELVPMLERLGLAFGADTNAEVGLAHTTYKLDLPRSDAETVDAALMIMREVASELAIEPGAVERERGVLANEYQARNAPQLRRVADQLSAALPEGRLGERISGLAENLDALTAEHLHNFYEGYYRPEKATMVMVGDFDPAEMEAKIRENFADWQGAGEARQSFIPSIPQRQTPEIDTFTDPSIAEIISLQSLAPYTPPPNTLADERDQLLRLVASLALTNRLSALSRSADSPTLGGQVAFQDLYRSAESAEMMMVAKDGQWRETAMLAEQELRRALQHGFTQAEVEEAKANFATALANAAAQAEGKPSAGKADLLTQASLSNSVAMSPDEQLRFYRSIEDSIAPESVTAAFREAWAGGLDLVHVSTKEPIESAQQAIAAALSESSQVAVASPAGEEEADFAYDDFGPAGEIVSDTRIEDLGIRSLTFANGTRLNLKTTDFEPSSITFRMNVGEGMFAFPGDKPGLPVMMAVALPLDGLEAHGPDELRRLLAGRQVSLAMSPAEDALLAAGTTTSEDLELQLKLLAARLVATGFRPETQAQWAATAPVLAQNIAGTPPQLLSSALNYVIGGEDARLGYADPSVLTERSLDELRAVLEPQLREGSVDVGLVGDFEEDAAIAAFASTIGALPPRESAGDKPANPPHFAQNLGPHVLTHRGAADQALVALSWPTDDGSDLRAALERSVLAQIFRLRLTETLREELGASYSPQAMAFSPPEDIDFGHLTALTTVDPAQFHDAIQVIKDVARELALSPVSEDLLQRARQPMAENMREQLTQNAGWASIVARAQRDPEYLDRRRQEAEFLEAITADDVHAQAREYLMGEPLELQVVAESFAAE